MYHGSTIARYRSTPGIQIVRRSAVHSRRSPRNKRMMHSARNGAIGPLASVAAAPKKYRSKSQNFNPVSYHAYHPSIPMHSGAAICMSVDAPRANPIIATDDAVISAASSCPPGRNRRMCRKIIAIRKNAPEAEGSRAAQSETPNSLNELIARQ